MPDDNKFEKLSEVGFRIPISCGLCIHGQFVGSSEWGECGKHRYQHKKHDNPEDGRGVSIVRAGTCDVPELDPTRVDRLGAHMVFVER
jgi:hypothetical protein